MQRSRLPTTLTISGLCTLRQRITGISSTTMDITITMGYWMISRRLVGFHTLHYMRTHRMRMIIITMHMVPLYRMVTLAQLVTFHSIKNTSPM